MLFNSYEFILCFLPLAFLGYYSSAHYFGPVAAKIWLIAASLVFYGWWNPAFDWLLVVSIGFNYVLSAFILKCAPRPGRQRVLLTAGIAANLSVLAYYKYLFAVLGFLYAHSFLATSFGQVILPLGISFFTFTQIGYLVDCQQGLVREKNLLDYVLFVTFFPHLIAGPILHHREIMPQFADSATYRPNPRIIASGLTLFAFGLVKKVLFADSIAPWADAGFSSPGQLGMLTAWSTALSYSMQLYFDFSGYSDMAIGLGGMFNVRMPLNFDSPYKSASIIDFWQRWHMTLTRYLTLLIYNPLALWLMRRRMAKGLVANRRASESPKGFLTLVAFPTFFTMFLAGIWHGAGLQFIVWGLLHALYLTVNHAWRIFGPKAAKAAANASGLVLGRVWRVALTYLSVLLAQVFFRAASVSDALKLLGGAIGLRGTDLPLSVSAFRWSAHRSLRDFLYQHGIIALSPSHHLWDTVTMPLLSNGALLLLFAVIVWGAPNSAQLLGDAVPALQKPLPTQAPLRWRPNLAWATGLGVVLCYVLTQLGQPGRFLYFQF